MYRSDEGQLKKKKGGGWEQQNTSDWPEMQADGNPDLKKFNWFGFFSLILCHELKVFFIQKDFIFFVQNSFHFQLRSYDGQPLKLRPSAQLVFSALSGRELKVG